MSTPTDPKLWQAYDQALAPLSTQVPMLLLPVRLEARWTAKELLIRVYPDVPQTDALARALTVDERSAGLALWDSVRAAAQQGAWRPADGFAVDPAPPGVADAHAAWKGLVDAVGAWRAAWIARETEDGEVTVGDDAGPFAALLPSRWAFVLRLGDKSELHAVGADIPRVLRVMPDFASADPFAAGAVKWLVDFPEAERVGMAIRLPISQLRMPLRSLIVVGVYTEKTEPDAVQDELERLLESHRYSVGLGMLASGTPTNNTEDASIAALRPDPLELWQRERTRVIRVSPRVGRRNALLPRDKSEDLSGGLLRWFGEVDPREEAGREAMQAALWPITWGEFFSSLRARDGTPRIGAAGLVSLAAHFREYVRADGPLPTLRIGAQPYGLLPVQPLVDGDDFVGEMSRVLRGLRDVWMKAAVKVPRLDPSADDGADGRPPAFLRVVNTHPWPQRYALRSTIDALSSDDWSASVLALRDFSLPTVPGFIGPLRDSLHEHNKRWRNAVAKFEVAGTVDTQIDILKEMRDFITWDVLTMVPAWTPPRLALLKHIDRLLKGVRTYHARLAKPLKAAGVNAGATGSFPKHAQTAGRHAPDPDTRRRWNRPGVTPGRSFLTVLAAALRKRGAIDLEGAQPGGLLDELLLAVVRSTTRGASDRMALAGHIDALIALSDATLERLLAGTLSLATTRLDAWLSAAATRRLASLRTRTPRGLLLGAYGCLEDLAPDRAPGEGYVLTPSLAHATTAAVLRSAFNTYGGDASSPYTIDLTSTRVQRARDVLAALEAGVRLSAILGQLAERILHDAHKDSLIDLLRASSTGDKARQTDGVKLARALRGGENLPPELEPVRAILEPVSDVFDAIADVGVFDAMHNLLQRDVAQVGSILEALDRGEGGVRPPASLDTPRSGTVVRHRLVALLPGGTGVGWNSRSLAALLAPPLERWAAHWLGPADRIVYALRWRQGEQVGTTRRSLADSLGALDLVRLSVAPELQATSPLAALLRGIHEAAPGLEILALEAFPVGLAAGETPLGEAVAVAHGLRGILGHARPLTREDLPPGAPTLIPASPPALAAWLASGSGDLRQYALAGIESAIAGLTAEPAAQQLQAGALRLAVAALAAGDPTARASLGLEWVPQLAAVPDPLPGSAAVTQEQLQAWLAGLARVRPAAATLAGTLRLVDAVRDTRSYRLVGVQTPDPAGAWVGHARPRADAQMCNSWVVLRPADATGEACGLVIDEWTERVPATEGTGGLAFHWNAPAARAPQALLLALPTAAWSLAGLAETVTQTLENARLRMVEQEHLDDVDELLPAIFLDGPINDGGPRFAVGRAFHAVQLSDDAISLLLEKP